MLIYSYTPRNIPFCWFLRFIFDLSKGRTRGVSKLAKGCRTVGVIVRAAMLFDASYGKTETIARQSNRAEVRKRESTRQQAKTAVELSRDKCLRGCGFVLVASRKWG